MSYRKFRVDLTTAQGRKILEGKPVRLSAGQLNKGPNHFWHPENYKRLVRAYEHEKGLTIHMSHGEVLRSHQSDLDGAGFWGDVWSGIKKGAKAVGSFIVKNWKPLAGVAMDIGTKYVPEAAPVRALVRETTGVGMAKPIRRQVPIHRVTGGSFRLTGP